MLRGNVVKKLNNAHPSVGSMHPWCLQMANDRTGPMKSHLIWLLNFSRIKMFFLKRFKFVLAQVFQYLPKIISCGTAFLQFMIMNFKQQSFSNTSL